MNTRIKTKPFIAKFFSALYISMVFYVTFLARRRRGNFDFRAKANFQLFDKFKPMNAFSSLPIKEQSAFLQDVLGNMIMFLPLIPAFSLLLNKTPSFGWSVAVIVAASGAVEIFQYIFNVGVFDLDDILLNGVGGIIGLITWRYFTKMQHL